MAEHSNNHSFSMFYPTFLIKVITVKNVGKFLNYFVHFMSRLQLYGTGVKALTGYGITCLNYSPHLQILML